ncbi:MAG TPA: hypothetical protein VFU01_04310 [Gemmatimonadaceae bacterium]|nr:hypothetical protein [Gemmatimonadaceae bacterium]
MNVRATCAAVLLALTTSGLRAQLPVRAGVSMSLTEHRVTAGAGLERSSGTLFGVWASATLPWESLEARASLRTGSLGANEAPAMDRDVGELTVSAVLPLNASIGLNGGVVVRRYESAFAAQRWVWGELGLDGRMSMLDDALDLSAGLSIIPWVSVSGISRPDLAVAARSMVAYNTGRLTATMRYRLERFDFAARQGVRRLEELSSLELGVAWRVR